MRVVSIIVVAIALVMGRATPSAAQGYLSPFIGYDVGGDAGSCPSLVQNCAEKKTTYGVTLGVLFGGLVGFEEDVAYAPDFFGQTPLVNNSVLTAMSNLVVSLPLPVLRPYASGGGGLLRTHAGFNSASLADVTDNSLGYDLGGGVMALLPFHLGVRADVRYVHAGQNVTIVGVTLPGTELHFSRISLGVVLH